MISKCLVSASFKIHYQFIKKIELNKTVRARNLQGPPFFFFFWLLSITFSILFSCSSFTWSLFSSGLL
jgi:hypothetical protein